MRVGLVSQLRNNRFRDLSKQLKEQERLARERAARVGASVARQLCPVSDEVKDKHLIDTIAVYIGPAGGVYLIAGDDEIIYAAFVDKGTVYMAPIPFYTKGREAMKKQLPKEYKRIRLR